MEPRVVVLLLWVTPWEMRREANQELWQGPVGYATFRFSYQILPSDSIVVGIYDPDTESVTAFSGGSDSVGIDASLPILADMSKSFGVAELSVTTWGEYLEYIKNTIVWDPDHRWDSALHTFWRPYDGAIRQWAQLPRPSFA